MRTLLLCLLVAVPLAGRAQPTASAPDLESWAEAVLDTLSLEAKVAQLFVTHANGSEAGTTPKELRRLRHLVRTVGVGGVLFLRGEAERQAALTRQLQRWARLPLLVAQDMEHGVGMRVEGTTAFPRPMALGAAGDPGLAYRVGRHVAREARVLGVHHNYAPVADVNNNPANPIINVRSFGEDPAAVGTLTTAMLRGMQDGGLIATAKHFPGHGDTDTDSHRALPLLPFDLDRLDDVELAPFREAIAAGVQAVMVGHLAVPALEPDATLPASLSPRIVQGLLRDAIGFRGLIVTDGLDMNGVTDYFEAGEIAVRAVEAGADLLVLTRAEETAHAALMKALRDGRLTEERIDASVRRILQAKASVGLHATAAAPMPLPSAGYGGPVGLGVQELAAALAARPAPVPPDEALLREGARLAEEVARRSVTLLRNAGSLLPLPDDRCLLVLSLDDGRDPQTPQPFAERLTELAGPGRVVHRPLHLNDPARLYDDAFAQVERHDVVVVPVYLRVRSWSGQIGLPEPQRRFIERLVRVGKPVVLVAFGNPYLPLGLAPPAATVAAYDDAPVTQRVVAEALLGRSPFGGRLPVSIPDRYRVGDGIRLPQQILRPAATDFPEVDALIERAIRDRVFPGAALAVGHDGVLVKLAGYGRHTYDADAPAVTPQSRFDLASLTKVVGTTLAAMRLYDEGRLDLDAPVARYLPAFGQAGKERVTVRQLLSHSAGQRAFHPFHQTDRRSREAILEFIYADPPRYRPGTSYAYSDFDMIVLGEVIEQITGQSLDRYLRETFYGPLRMADTGFRAPGTFDPRAVPTEHDRTFRRRLLQGEVHDEAASLLGGVAGHAGLFATAEDLARLAFMLANGGLAHGQRFVREETIRLFTTRVSPAGAYPTALGWMAWRPSREGYSSGGTRLSAGAYGHTGFTGTSLWIDPERRLFVILLTNRVYPERSESRIGRVRAAVMDAVVEALEARGEEGVGAGTVPEDLRYAAPLWDQQQP